ncbi:MAG: hypothetical protein Q4E74_09745 [Ruminococcus sp.]|nr:hypothetical protein [Ruminococcus sp.]
MDKETILKATECCADENNVEHCDCCPLNEMSMNCGYYFAKYLADKEFEPAPAGTETSPKNKNLHFDNNTISEICQEALRKISSNASLHADVYAQATLDIIAKFKGGQK